MAMKLLTLRWNGDWDGSLFLLDQTKLPAAILEIECQSVSDVWNAIRRLAVRGAPAIGIAAAYGVVLGISGGVSEELAKETSQKPSKDPKEAAIAAIDYLATSRPTAVNLFWALERMRSLVILAPANITREQLASQILAEAKAIHEEDKKLCAAMGEHGAKLLQSLLCPEDGLGVLTHCNAGALATGGEGTALAVLFALHSEGNKLRVYADETRPLLQGARLTMWELTNRNIDATLICDSMAATVMREGRIQAVITGADRIAANGDAANKIGTYGLALAAAAHNIPLYIVAPSTTFDLSLATGESIPIEERPAEEITHIAGKAIAPASANVYNPAFDVTPARLIEAIICESGVIAPVTKESVRVMLS